MLRVHTLSGHPEVFFHWPHLTGGLSSHQQLILTPFPLRSAVAASPIKLISRDLISIPFQFSDVPISTCIERASLPNKVDLSIVICELEAQYWPHYALRTSVIVLFSRTPGVYCLRLLFWRQTEAWENWTSKKWPLRDRSVQCFAGNTGSWIKTVYFCKIDFSQYIF